MVTVTAVTVTLLYDATKQFFIMISDKHRNSLVVNIYES